MSTSDYLNKITTGDCLKVIPGLSDESVDLVVTSIPYNVDHPYDVYVDKKPHRDYIEWAKEIFKVIYPKLKKGARVCLNVGDGCNGRVPTHVDLSVALVDLGYLFMNTIIWAKRTSLRTSWGSFMSPKEPSLPCPFEYILVFAKETYSLQDDGVTDLTKREFIDWSLSLWTFDGPDYRSSSNIINRGIHPAPFPEALPTRLIKMFSWIGATVLDPMAGSGSTCLACKKLYRKYIGIELSEAYSEYARQRLKYVVYSPSLFDDVEFEEKSPEKDNLLNNS